VWCQWTGQGRWGRAVWYVDSVDGVSHTEAAVVDALPDSLLHLVHVRLQAMVPDPQRLPPAIKELFGACHGLTQLGDTVVGGLQEEGHSNTTVYKTEKVLQTAKN
jgi:hypothetical protein